MVIEGAVCGENMTGTEETHLMIALQDVSLDVDVLTRVARAVVVAADGAAVPEVEAALLGRLFREVCPK
jgi:hypothetical protein